MNFTSLFITRIKAYSPEQILVIILLFIYPVFALAIRHTVTISFLLLAIIFIFSLYRDNAWFNKNTWDHETIAFTLAMMSPALAVLFSQVMRMDFSIKPYDEALRFAIAIPIYLGIRSIKIPIIAILEYAFPIGALCSLLFSHLTLSGRLSVWFLSSIHYGDIELVLGLFSLFAFQWNYPRHLLMRILQVMGFIAGVYLSILSGTRGGWIIIPPLILIWIFYQNEKRYWFRNILAIGLALMLIILLSYLSMNVISERLNAIFQDFSVFIQGQRDTPIGLRLQIWQVTLRLFLENPLFGIGTVNYHHQLKLFGQAGIISNEAVIVGIAEVHQQVLSYAVKYGIFGAISMLSIHVVPLILFVFNARMKTSSQIELLGIFIVVSFFIFGLTIEIFTMKTTIAFYCLTVAAILGASYANVHKVS